MLLSVDVQFVYTNKTSLSKSVLDYLFWFADVAWKYSGFYFSTIQRFAISRSPQGMQLTRGYCNKLKIHDLVSLTLVMVQIDYICDTISADIAVCVIWQKRGTCNKFFKMLLKMSVDDIFFHTNSQVECTTWSFNKTYVEFCVAIWGLHWTHSHLSVIDPAGNNFGSTTIQHTLFHWF